MENVNCTSAYNTRTQQENLICYFDDFIKAEFVLVTVKMSSRLNRFQLLGRQAREGGN